ncbi:3-deoxy-7-phosphoheptulonate synthase [Candidatus Saccharibacteria bacterium RIFCSPHIGHO2_02_FULL_47_12]|nr:MAG: 3-deoxy-7-phosphoheptulonate synthase [Candidatus Saccharibacteria bacterium RIFCSPHIGHO2_02_FULL_47_12]
MQEHSISHEAQTENLHIRNLRPLLAPSEVKLAHPATERSIETVAAGRTAIHAALDIAAPSDRLVVITGGCSIHNVDEALEYTHWLREERSAHGNELELVQRVYFEKPRTTIGWEGFINDPNLDESFDINYGLMAARKLVGDITDLGVPIGTELLDNITVQYYAGLVSWGAIGARTTESPLHKRLASGLSFPVGFKNGTGGSVQLAVDAVVAAKHSHHFPAITDEGKAAIASTKGNPDCHIILRGGSQSPNYDAESIEEATGLLVEAGLSPIVMVDVSHANSNKDYRNQMIVIEDIVTQIASGSTAIMGVMIESNLKEGKQTFEAGKKHEYGVSITDGCVSLDETDAMLQLLAEAVKARR